MSRRKLGDADTEGFVSWPRVGAIVTREVGGLIEEHEGRMSELAVTSGTSTFSSDRRGGGI